MNINRMPNPSSQLTTTTTTTTTTITANNAGRGQLSERAAMRPPSEQFRQSYQSDSMAAPRASLPSEHTTPPPSAFKVAYDTMTPAKAAQMLLSNFDAVEGVGTDKAGAGAGDGNIGAGELRRVADPGSGFPPGMRAAAKWLLDHPTSARAIDQGASQSGGDPSEYQFSQADLKSFVASSSEPEEEVGDDEVGDLDGPGDADEVESGGPAEAASGEAESGEVRDVYGAAKVLRDNFNFIEGLGMNGVGAGAGDGNIGLSELRVAADPKSGAPENVRQAAQFLLDHVPALSSINQTTKPGGAFLRDFDVHLGMKDLNAFLANGPKQSSRASGQVEHTRTVNEIARASYIRP